MLPQTVCDAVMSNDMKRSLTELLDEKLSATEADTAEGEITFESGLIANGDGVTATKVDAPLGNFIQLTSGKTTTNHIESADYDGVTSGFKLAIVDGDSYLEVDKLSVRKNAIFNELDIKSLKHIGGAILLSPASCKIALVEDVMSGSTITGYKCYFLATDGEETINNEWKVGDQAICNKYNITKLHHYWRLVTAVSASPINGYHYVILSATDCDDFSNVPQAGDEIVCLGNRNDVDRQGAIFLNSEGTDAPSLLQLNGINSYSLESKNIITQLSKSRNIIRGQQVEVITESGNKSVKQFADEALAGANNYSDNVGNALKEFVGERETYLQAQITQNAGNITLKADKTLVDGIEDRVTKAEASIKVNADGVSANAKSVTVLGNRLTTAETNIKVNSKELSSVVSKQEKVGIEYPTSKWVGNDGFSYFVFKNGGGYYVVYSKDPQAYYDSCTLLTIENVSAGDKIHIEGNNMFIHIIGCDGDYQGAENDFGQEYPSDVGNYNVLGFGDDHYSDDGVSIVDWVATSNWAKVYIMLTDDNPSAYQTAKTTLIKSAYTAESRIRQTADEIELKVGNAGIDINKKQITLSASNTIVKGDLSVQVVKTYYPDGSVMSAFNGSGNGTVIYYYPNGNKMREDCFEYDADGNASGMVTIYYDINGNVKWRLTSSGLVTTLADYWSYKEGYAYASTRKEVVTAIKAYKTSGVIDLPTAVFSIFHATTASSYQQYNGKVAKGRIATYAIPDGVAWWQSGYYFYPMPMQRINADGSITEFFVVYHVVDGVQGEGVEYDVI